MGFGTCGFAKYQAIVCKQEVVKPGGTLTNSDSLEAIVEGCLV